MLLSEEDEVVEHEEKMVMGTARGGASDADAGEPVAADEVVRVGEARGACAGPVARGREAVEPAASDAAADRCRRRAPRPRTSTP